ncbi:Hypothetical predicted protein [Mytilus galloprovincialis]|uniref:Chitin-binding type-2 domain-containing protein n=1 Tax=Mytilus galloprovincialis TaxID=29158 RepID=A0A8B6F6S7_MYTGA|nr:Hypothetical predicted protein [Mytilus galloprovincialis]
MDSTGATYAQELCESTDSKKSDPYATFDGARTDQELSSSDSSGKSKDSEGSSVGYANITEISRDTCSVPSANHNITQLNAINVDEVASAETKSNDSIHNESGQIYINQSFIEDSGSSANSGSSTKNESFGNSGPFETDILTSDMPIFTATKGRHKFYQNWKTGKDVCWNDSTTWPGFKHRCCLNEITFSQLEPHSPAHNVSIIDPVDQHIDDEVKVNTFPPQIADLPLPPPNPMHNAVDLQPPDEIAIAFLPLPPAYPEHNDLDLQPPDEVAAYLPLPPAYPEHNAVNLQPPDDVAVIHEDPGWQPPRNICIWNSSANKKLTVIVCICLCIGGALLFSTKFNNLLDSEILKDPPFTVAVPIPDKCEKEISAALFGERICIPYTQKFTSSPSGVHVRQLSSQYFSKLEVFSANVSSDEFVQQFGNWIINFNSSRTDQQFRFVKEKATCDSIGNYEITIDYGNENVTSFEFEIGFKDSKLEQRVTRINNTIHVYCGMMKTCKASSLALFVNDGNSSRMIPNINVCSNNDEESGTTVSADAKIPASRFSRNQTISCVPLMTDPELAANLTSTTGIPVCEGGDCVPDCRNDPQGEAYYPDKYICNIFHQCSNGDTISQTCPLSTYWSPSKCTCVNFDDEICDQNTYRFYKPLMSIDKCTNAS